MKTCFSCGQELDIDGKPGRGEECPHCGSDVKVCLNCRFFSPGAHNDCVETMADRVVDKDRANYCEYFEFKDNGLSKEESDPLNKLKNLFK